MLEIISEIRASNVPVVVYVAPRNAIAGSAGAMITMAGHASAMAPETVHRRIQPDQQFGRKPEFRLRKPKRRKSPKPRYATM